MTLTEDVTVSGGTATLDHRAPTVSLRHQLGQTNAGYVTFNVSPGTANGVGLNVTANLGVISSGTAAFTRPASA